MQLNNYIFSLDACQHLVLLQVYTNVFQLPVYIITHEVKNSSPLMTHIWGLIVAKKDG